jgi:hypothetical protein
LFDASQSAVGAYRVGEFLLDRSDEGQLNNLPVKHKVILTAFPGPPKRNAIRACGSVEEGRDGTVLGANTRL